MNALNVRKFLSDKKMKVNWAIPALIACALVLMAIGQGNAAGIPIINITSVEQNTSVTISGYNFPAQTFTVRMGPYGTLGIGGTVVGTKDPASGSAFTATYNIPAALVGAARIAIRLESPEGYYSYNWFYNQPSTVPIPAPGVTPVPGYTGIPTFNISAVKAGETVSILTSNLPASQLFTVRMGEYGTLALGGTVVGTLDSGSGGTLSQTFTIPAALVSRAKIAIRMDCPLGYYSYNWFYNNTSPVSPSATPAVTLVPAYYGIPTFSIISVVKDVQVTISTFNFPPGQTFTVKMGEFGTMGIGGIVVTTTDSASGGSFSKTYAIPAALAGRSKIAIRLESANGYFYAYNWFYNNTTD